MRKFSIISPPGAYGNHIRWLALLDQQFSLRFISRRVLRDHYNTVAGTSWPPYEQFITKDFSKLPQEIVEELLFKFFDVINFTTLENKLNFIQHRVYPINRTYYNWISYEGQFRSHFDHFIFIDHEYGKTVNDFRKTLLVTADPILSYRSYVKFNSMLNNVEKNTFINYIHTENEKHRSIARTKSNTKILDATVLYNETLDYSWYQSLIEFFELDDNYPIACKIHKLWFDGHQRARTELLDDLSF